MGYSLQELGFIQATWRLRFPPDLIELLRVRRPLIPGGFDWLDSPKREIQRVLAWPFEGLLFDVRECGIWREEWGEKPVSPKDQADRLRQVVAEAPKLIPLFGHRYLPDTPFESGNPVLSVYQSDVICYGADLADWLIRETLDSESRRHLGPPEDIKSIPFWFEALE